MFHPSIVSKVRVHGQSLVINAILRAFGKWLGCLVIFVIMWLSCDILECIEEHQYLIELSKTRGLTDKVILVSFQDSIENSIDFLNEYGRGDIIYAIDTESKLAIYSGVFGVPETHIILNNKIVKKYIGTLSLSDLEEIINSYLNE